MSISEESKSAECRKEPGSFTCIELIIFNSKTSSVKSLNYLYQPKSCFKWLICDNLTILSKELLLELIWFERSFIVIVWKNTTRYWAHISTEKRDDNKDLNDFVSKKVAKLQKKVSFTIKTVIFDKKIVNFIK